MKASRAVCRILSNDAVNSRKNPFGFILFFAKPFANFFEALQVEQQNYYGSELFQWGDGHFLYKCVLMQFFVAAEWTVRRSEWFDLAPGGYLQVDSLEVCFMRIRPINSGRDHAHDFSKSFHVECLKFADL